MNIAILNCSSPYEKLAHHGSPADLIEGWLTPHFPEAVFSQINIAGGASIPKNESIDGVIVSGSEKGVYDECDWMLPLKTYLQELRALQIPVFGICFGHQLMAEAYGGKAEKAQYGFVVGSRSYTDSHTQGHTDASAKSENSYSAYAMHKDQVVRVPDSATITASSPYCPVAALEYNFPARSVQFHPEFTTQLVADAIEAFDGELLTGNEAESARHSMNNSDVQQALYATEAVEFFRQATR